MIIILALHRFDTAMPRMRRTQPTKAWGAVAAVTGAMLVVAAAPGRAPDADTTERTLGGPPREAAVTLLVGRVLEEGHEAGGERCAVRMFRPGLCSGWQEQRVLATARGVGSVLKEPTLREGDAARAARQEVLPTDARGPLEITLADAGRLTDVTVQDGHGRHLAGELGPHSEHWLNTEPLRAGRRTPCTWAPRTRAALRSG